MRQRHADVLTHALGDAGETDENGTNRSSALRFNTAMWVFAAAFLPLFVLAFPPTAAAGGAGWAAAAAWMVLHLGVIAWLVLAKERVTMRFLLVTQYVELGCLLGLQWLAGGWEAPYHQLMFVHVLNVAMTHPRRLSRPYMALAAMAVFAPAAYGETDGRLPDVAVMFVLWFAVIGFVSAVMDRVRMQRLALAGQARSDALTNLDNRRAFDESASRRVDAARASGRTLVLGIGDVDNFKAVNDKHGHQAGDACLQAVAEALRSACREGDRVFRWGGDEFAVLLEGANRADVTAVCRRLEEAVATQVTDPDGTPIRLTVGWAFDTGSASPSDLVAAADASLLALKRPRAAA